ncbi:hypothetical protein [Streptomyces sp. SM11]|uniref:hypothetical protein n=1 Tax=Streptomyces sp. SM11 TaxID=565557 RepID=UPI002155FF9D|nr:hypothetical protein [Streptomyces sp. SM11]
MSGQRYVGLGLAAVPPEHRRRSRPAPCSRPEPRWTGADRRAEAGAALRGALTAASDELVRDSALCHGWAGLPQIVLRTAHDNDDQDLHAVADRLAARVLDGFTPEPPFGFRYAYARDARTRPLRLPGGGRGHHPRHAHVRHRECAGDILGQRPAAELTSARAGTAVRRCDSGGASARG